MDNEREDEIEPIRRISSMDSLEPNESNGKTLRCISGGHKWLNSNGNNVRVEKVRILNESDNSVHQEQFSIIKSTRPDIEQSKSTQMLSQLDLSLNHYDVQLQVNGGQMEQAVRYGVFTSLSTSSSLSSICVNTFKINQYSQTPEPETDMDSRDGRTNGSNSTNSKQYNGYNQNNSYSNNNGDGSHRRSQQSNGSSGSGDGNGSNPNRNNNPRRPGDDASDDNDDDDECETDETLARRLGFRVIDQETLRVIARLRRLTSSRTYDRRAFENAQYLIDDLIRLQHLEDSSQDQLERIVHDLKLYRILRTKSNALQFIQDRLPQRQTTRSSNDNNSNVFNLWRERERRARLDSKDSLEEEGPVSNGNQCVNERTETSNRPASPTLTTQNKSKVRQMARNIDTKSSSARNGDHIRKSSSSSPTNFNTNNDSYRNETFVDERFQIRRTVSPVSNTEPRRVRQMIDRLESSSGSNGSAVRKGSLNKSFHDDQLNSLSNSTSMPNVKRMTRRETHEFGNTNGHNDCFVFRHKSPHEEVFVPETNPAKVRFEIDRNDCLRSGRRNAHGVTVDEYLTSLVPGAETSISIVRDVRARFYDDDCSLSHASDDNVPVKVDVETLYILEQRSEKPTLPSTTNTFISDYEYNRTTTTDRQDFGAQTIIPPVVIKPPNRPIATQVDSTVEQSTVAAQTTDSLHRPIRERQRLRSLSIDDEDVNEVIRTTKTTTTKYEVKRRHSSHHTSEEEEDPGVTTIIYTDDNDNIEIREQSAKDFADNVFEDRAVCEQTTHVDHSCDVSRNGNHRHIDQTEFREDQPRSSEVYEVHTRGACKCLVVSYEERTQYGAETRFENQLQRIERTYTEEELKTTELHVIVASSDDNYQLVRRDYGSATDDKIKSPSITIHYYTRDGVRTNTERARRLENLPLFIRCEIEYELNHYGSAQLIVLAVTNAERRQMTVSIKKEIVDDIVAQTSGRLAPNSPELEKEISRRLSEQISLLHLVDYSSRDDHNLSNSTDLRRVTCIDVTTSLRIVQRYRTIIHRLCQTYRSHLRLSPQAEQQRHIILVARDEYYLLDLASQTATTSTNKVECQQRNETFQREVRHVPQQPFDYAKYRRDMEQQQRIIEQHYKKPNIAPPPQGSTCEAEFYLGSGRRALIEREIHSMREAIRPHEHAPPRYKNEPRRRSLSISYSGGQRYVRARIIHVKDYYETKQQEQQQQAKEQELFVRVDDFINESAAHTLRRSYSTDYLHEDGPRSRIRYIRIPGETIRIEEKTTYEYQGVMYANLPYGLKYWNILYILDREAREGRALGSSLPHVIVNDPYRTVIPPLTQQEIRQTAQQVMSPQYNARSYTDQTLRWFLSRDQRTEVEATKYLHALNQYRHQQQQQQNKQTNITVQNGERQGVAKKYYVTETLVHYEKMPDRLVPVSVNDRAQSIDNLHHRSPSTPCVPQQVYHSQTQLNRSQSQPRPQFQPSPSTFTPNTRAKLPSMNVPLSRHQSVHELYVPPQLSHPPSPSPSLRSLHSNHQPPHHHHHHHNNHHRRPVAFNNRFPIRPNGSTPAPAQQHQNGLLTEIIDSQTGQRILTTSQEQLPTEVLGLLNKYNLQQF